MVDRGAGGLDDRGAPVLGGMGERLDRALDDRLKVGGERLEAGIGMKPAAVQELRQRGVSVGAEPALSKADRGGQALLGPPRGGHRVGRLPPRAASAQNPVKSGRAERAGQSRYRVDGQEERGESGQVAKEGFAIGRRPELPVDQRGDEIGRDDEVEKGAGNEAPRQDRGFLARRLGWIGADHKRILARGGAGPQSPGTLATGRAWEHRLSQRRASGCWVDDPQLVAPPRRPTRTIVDGSRPKRHAGPAWAGCGEAKRMCVYDECARPGRREFLVLAAAGVAGLADATRASDPPAAAGTEILFPSPVGPVRAYLATPAGRGRHPAVLVLQAQLGLPDWARAAADELAGAGFVALALFGFSRSPGLTEEALRADGRGPRHFISETYFREGQQELLGAVDYLQRLPSVRRGPIGAVGFCGGGVRAVRFAIASPAIGAVVSFYGPPAFPAQYKNAADPSPNLVDIGAQLHTPLQIHYGTADYVVHAADVNRLADELRAAGTPVEVFSYEGATHAFYRSHEPAANAAATEAARPRYLAFLHARLG